MANIEIKFLGTGSAFSKKWGNNSALVTVDNNGVKKRLLIDCGRTTPDDMHHIGLTFADIDAIFITHLHGDHVYGLEEAGFYGRFVLNKKPHLILPHEKIKTDLWDRVLKGTMMQGDLDRPMVFGDYFSYEIVHKTEQYFLFNDVMFSVFSTEHVKNKKSFGLIIGEADFVVYTSDSLLNRDFVELLASNGAQKIFHDCQMEEYEGKTHASLSDLSQLSENARGKIAVMHYGDDLDYDKVVNLGMSVASKYKDYNFTVL